MPTAIILLGVALVNFYSYQDVTEDLVIERDQDLTRLSASQLGTELAKHTDLLFELARTARVSQDGQAAQDVLERDASPRAVFDGGVIILDTFGTVVATTPERSELLGQDWSDRSHFRQMLRSPRPTFSNALADGLGGEEVIAAAVPITGDQGEFLGSAVGMFRLQATGVSAFYGGIVKLRIAEGGGGYVVDGNGRVLYHFNTDRIGADFSAQPSVQQVLSGRVGAIRTGALDGTDIVAGFAPIPGTPWGLVTEESWSELTKASRDDQRFLLLLLALGVAVPAVLVAVGLRQIMRPVDDLVRAVRQVARGNFGQTIAVRSGDEIGELAAEFNLMSAELQESYTHLEERVAARTEELRESEEAERLRTQELEALFAVASIFVAPGDIEHKVTHVLEAIAGAGEAGRVALRLYDEEEQVLRLVSHVGLGLQELPPKPVLPLGQLLSGQAFQRGEPLVVNDYRAHPEADAGRVAEGMKSGASLILKTDERLIGTVEVSSKQLDHFTPERVNFLTAIVDGMGVLLDNARLLEGVRESEKRYRNLFEESRDAIFVSGAEGEIVAINQAGLDLLGFTRDEAIGSDMDERYVDPTDRVRARKAMKQTGSIVDFEIKLRKWDGAEIDCLMTATFMVGFDATHGVQGVVRDVTERKRAEQELLEQTRDVAVLEERNRMAREIHDTMAQGFTGIVLQLEAGEQALDETQEETLDHLGRAKTLARECLQAARRSVWNLLPRALEERPLSSALEEEIRQFTAVNRERAVFDVSGDARDLKGDVQTALLRICQQALTNVRSHAQATEVTVALSYTPDSVQLEIRDNGVGFDPDATRDSRDQSGFGLAGMEQRARLLGGDLNVTSKKGGGTRVEVKVPTS